MSQKVVLITGGSRGIGLAMVDIFQRAGFAVAACATTSEGAARSSADFAFACDVSRPTDVKRGVAGTLERFGRIDVLINNAAIAGANPFTPEAEDDLWYRIIDVNLHGTYLMCKHVLDHLPEGGRIINIASTLALRGVPDQTAYCAAKHGVLGLTRALALHAAPRQISVNAICPGWVRTDMAAQRASELASDAASLAAGVPIGRMVEPEEVANLALYLTSSAATPITGQALTIDGGSLA